MVSFKAFPAVALAGVLASAQASLAAEGGFSFYLPGIVGDIGLAQSSEPGLQVANSVYFLSGDAGAAVLQGKVNAGLDLTMALDIVSAGYTFEQEVLGATYTVGAAIPFGYAELEATITFAGGRSFLGPPKSPCPHPGVPNDLCAWPRGVGLRGAAAVRWIRPALPK